MCLGAAYGRPKDPCVASGCLKGSLCQRIKREILDKVG